MVELLRCNNCKNVIGSLGKELPMNKKKFVSCNDSQCIKIVEEKSKAYRM